MSVTENNKKLPQLSESFSGSLDAMYARAFDCDAEKTFRFTRANSIIHQDLHFTIIPVP